MVLKVDATAKDEVALKRNIDDEAGVENANKDDEKFGLKESFFKKAASVKLDDLKEKVLENKK